MQVDIVMKPVFDLHLSHQAIKLLMRISAAHYDGRCQAAGQVGGFLYGWNNHASWVEEHRDDTYRATSHDIDTLMKTCEVARAMLTAEEMVVIDDFRKACADAMVKAGVWAGPIVIGAHDV